MALPVTADVVENVSEMFQLFEKRWTLPKQIIFRGEPKEYDPILSPSAFRCGPPSDEFDVYKKNHSEYYLNDKRDYMFDRLYPEPEALSLPFIALAQHYGTKTRLLDVTLNPLVALFFAVSKHPDDDGFVFFFIENFLDLRLFPDFQDLNKIIGSDRIGDYRPYDDTCLFFKPEWPNARIAAQHGAFIFTKGYAQSIWSGGGIFRIPSERKSEIIKQLDRFGISEPSLFPELEITSSGGD